MIFANTKGNSGFTIVIVKPYTVGVLVTIGRGLTSVESMAVRGILWLCVTLVATAEVAKASSQSSTAGSSRLQEVQQEFLDVVGNSTVSVKNVGELMAVLHSQAGQQMGRLLLEGVLLGVGQKDSREILSHFWAQLQERLPTEIQDQLEDYSDFIRGMEFSTFPLMWEQLFKKDHLGNSLADLPLGQLIDLVQPTASRYGIDIRAFMNSLMGKGENNARDLILETINNLDIMSLMSKFVNSTLRANTAQTMDVNPEPATGGRLKQGEKLKKGKGEEMLRLFRPLVASLLRENNLDLDADAVLEVISPLLSGDMLAQAAPLLATLGSQAGDGLAPIIANILGGGEGRGKQQHMGSLIGGLGAMLAGGGGEKMDIGAMIKMASLFMDGSKSPKRSKKEEMKKDPARAKGPDMNTFANLVGKLAEKDIDIGSLLETASNFLSTDKRKDSPTIGKKRKEEQESRHTTSSIPPAAQKTAGSKNSQSSSPQARVVPKKGSKPRHLIDVVEPILLRMQTDKKCNRKIKDAITLSKAFLNKKMLSIGDLSQLLPYLATMAGSEFMDKNGKNVNNLVSNIKKILAHSTWEDFLENLDNEDERETLARTVTPHLAGLVTLLASQEVQRKLYDAAVPRTQAFFTSYGLPGITFENFPERVAPMLNLMVMGWKLPFNPATLLVPLRDYLQDLLVWTKAGLASIHDLPSHEVEHVVLTSLRDACDGVMAVRKVVRGAKVDCLPQLLCQVNQGLQPSSLRAAVTRTASLVLGSGPALEKTSPTLLMKIVQAASNGADSCEIAFPGNCASQLLDEDEESARMNLKYDHQEL